MMIPGLVLMIIVPLSYTLASSPVSLYPIRMILGLALGLTFGNGFLLMTEASGPETRNTAQGLYMTSMGIGFTVGPLVGGFTTKLYGTSYAFIISSVFGAISLLLLYFVDETKAKPTRKKDAPASFFASISDPKIFAGGVANFLNSLMYNAVTLFFPVYGAGIGFDESQIGTAFTARGLASTGVRLPVGALTKHVRALVLMVAGLVVSSLTIFSVSTSSGLILISVLMGLQGVAYGVYLTSGNVYVAGNSDEDNRGTAMAVYSMFGNLSGIINPLILGLIAETYGSQGALKFSSIMTLFGLLFVYILASRKPADAAKAHV
jgi:MFS family permease